jgi:pimeloyl-ACP methyl ester carboxylesterase
VTAVTTAIGQPAGIPVVIPAGSMPSHSNAPAPAGASAFVDVAWRGRTVRIEHQWLSPERSGRPLVVFLHEGLGSVSMWRDFPQRVKGLIVLAPHILVEDVSITSITAARTAYETTDLRQRLARHHDDPDSAFWGWNHIWLDPAFRDWSIEGEIGAIDCPLLAIQGLDDEYGTLEQVRGIARRVPQTRLLELPNCGHSPHRDQPEAVVRAVGSFMQLL